MSAQEDRSFLARDAYRSWKKVQEVSDMMAEIRHLP